MAANGFKVALAVAFTIAMTAAANAAGWIERNAYLLGPRYEAVLPPCDYGNALGEIQSNFAQKETRYWNSNLAIVDFERVREIAFMPWQRGAHDAIPRRYCSAVALVSDGRKRPVYYSIIEDTGFIGATWGVEWCVVGLDRNWAYNPACKAARP